MIRFLILIVVTAVMTVVLLGCASAPVQVDCKLPEPPASLLTIPAALPPIPADLLISPPPK